MTQGSGPFRMMGAARKQFGRRLGAPLAIVSVLVAGPATAAGTFYVDTNNPSANDAGPGTEAQPYKTISAAARVRGGPGTTIIVKPGVYGEQVTIDTSGTAAQPYVLQGLGSGVLLDGSDDFGDPGLWAAGPGSSWLAASVSWSPVQVFADGARLAVTALDPASMPAGTFRYIAGTGLYVNVGGNPGLHAARVGHRSHGFRIPARDYVTIQGFEVKRTEDHGIYLVAGSNNCTVRRDTVMLAATHGIAVQGGTGILIELNSVSDNHDHGINFLSGVTNSIVQDNESFHNTRIFQRAADGMMLFASSNNVIQRNRFHDNEDTGLDLTNGANNNISIENLSWNNGDHGFDHIGATGTLHVNDVAFGNHDDGMSFEGLSTGSQVWNCILANNGLATGRFDVLVDSSSAAGYQANYNIIWNSTTQNPIKFRGVQYQTLTAFRIATGQDAQSFQSDPRFVNAAGGNFHLTSGSQAIDSGNSAAPHWPPKDIEGRARIDDSVAPNTGSGPIPYSDRGAYEFDRSGSIGVEDLAASRVSLGPAFPNPTRGSVTFVAALVRAGRVQWAITDVTGRIVARQSATFAAGRTPVRWAGLDARGRRVPAGLYVMRLTADRATLVRPFTIFR